MTDATTINAMQVRWIVLASADLVVLRANLISLRTRERYVQVLLTTTG